MRQHMNRVVGACQTDNLGRSSVAGGAGGVQYGMQQFLGFHGRAQLLQHLLDDSLAPLHLPALGDVYHAAHPGAQFAVRSVDGHGLHLPAQVRAVRPQDCQVEADGARLFLRVPDQVQVPGAGLGCQVREIPEAPVRFEGLSREGLPLWKWGADLKVGVGLPHEIVSGLQQHTGARSGRANLLEYPGAAQGRRAGRGQQVQSGLDGQVCGQDRRGQINQQDPQRTFTGV